LGLHRARRPDGRERSPKRAGRPDERVRLREQVAANTAILERLAEIDKTLLEHDSALRDLYRKLLPLLQPPPEPRKRSIGFHTDND
jgi:hypothetical protein